MELQRHHLVDRGNYSAATWRTEGKTVAPPGGQRELQRHHRRTEGTTVAPPGGQRELQRHRLAGRGKIHPHSPHVCMCAVGPQTHERGRSQQAWCCQRRRWADSEAWDRGAGLYVSGSRQCLVTADWGNSEAHEEAVLLMVGRSNKENHVKHSLSWLRTLTVTRGSERQ